MVFLSDGGPQKKRFAVVQAEGIVRPIVVPTDRLKYLEAGADKGTIIGYNGSRREETAGRE